MVFFLKNIPNEIMDIPVTKIKPVLKKNSKTIMQPVVLAYFNKNEVKEIPIIPPEDMLVPKTG